MELPSIVYSLQGASLEIAKKIHATNQQTQEELACLEAEVEAFRQSLLQKFEDRYQQGYRDLFQEMATSICVPISLLQSYHLDLTYLDSHGLAFLKEGPIEDNVVVLNVEQPICVEPNE